MKLKRQIVAKKLCHWWILLPAVIQWEQLHWRLVDREGTGQTTSHPQLYFVAALQLVWVLVVVELFAAGKVWPSVQQHSTAAEDQLVQTSLVHLTVPDSRSLLDLNSKHYHT